MNLKHRLKIVISAVLVASFALVSVGCLSLKPSSSKGNGDLFETFYIGGNNIQYFIKPLVLESDEGHLDLDITFRANKETLSTDSASMKLSIFTERAIKTIDSVKFSNGNFNFTIIEPERIFSEKSSKGLIKNRYTAQVLQKDVVNLFEDSNWKCWVYEKNGNVKYIASKKTAKNIKILKSNIFDLI